MVFDWKSKLATTNDPYNANLVDFTFLQILMPIGSMSDGVL